jgi:hypothetical protein
VIGAVIAISIIPLLVLSVINIKKSLETEKITITIELDFLAGVGGDYKFKRSLSRDELIDYYEKGFTITNLYDYTNDINITITNVEYLGPGSFRMFDNNSVRYDLYADDLDISKTYDSIYNANARNIALMDITFTRSKANLTTTLLSFISVIFAGGVVLYIYKQFKKD